MKEIQEFKFGELHQIAQIKHVNLIGYIEELTGDLYVHLDIFEKEKWSISLYKEMLKTWAEIQVYLKEKLKISKMKTIIIENDIITEKFLSLFGFISEDHCFVLEDGSSYLVMEMEF